ncbi:hypothetical protein, partial [Streptosporangium sp. NPDC006007]|uniref:hypothetical protein n=1 Tax=Streptosporangium sp. NPDC006007 TaxID=3154575 RepID=UPI00339EBAF9
GESPEGALLSDPGHGRSNGSGEVGDQLSNTFLEAAGGFVILFGLGLVIAYVGYQLVRGDSLKDALYFLSFFH